jgi:AcrR family transcriptional regulator
MRRKLEAPGTKQNKAAKSALPPLNRHQQKTETTRRALLKAARKIFARDGFEACRIEDIAAGAGYTRGAFYAHFQTKQDLFFALLEQETNLHLKDLRDALEKCESDGERLGALREYFVHRSLDRQWATLILEFKLFAIRHPKVHADLAATHRRIRASSKVGYLAAKPGSEAVRAALEAVLVGLTIERAYDPSRLSREEASTLLGDIFDALVTPRG